MNELPYKYRALSGKEVSDLHAYTGDPAVAVAQLKQKFLGSATPLIEIDGKRLFTLPCIHLNGTGVETLVDDYSGVAQGIATVLRKLESIEFHRRDYYPLADGAWEAATLEHHRRILMLEQVRQEMMLIAEHCAQFRKERT